MEAVIALVVAGVSVLWWRRERKAAARDMIDAFDGDAQVALHVAQHELRTRGQPTVCSVHVLYGLLQDQHVTDAIRACGGDVDALEDRVLAALETVVDHQRLISDDAHQLLARALASSQASRRPSTVTDLWAYLIRSEAAELLAASKIDGVAVLHVLVHAAPLPEPTATATGDVHVVIRNDDYTSFEFVSHVLTHVFGLGEPDAAAKARTTHESGKAIVTRLPHAEARAKIGEARELAKTQRFPLWIAEEPI